MFVSAAIQVTYFISYYENIIKYKTALIKCCMNYAKLITKKEIM